MAYFTDKMAENNKIFTDKMAVCGFLSYRTAHLQRVKLVNSSTRQLFLYLCSPKFAPTFYEAD
jgi:hypothetical protein